MGWNTRCPKTVYFTAHTPLNKKDYRENITSLGMKNNPMGYDFTETYNSAEPHHGIGVSAFNYSTGYINRINGMLNYAYHMGLTETWSLGGGFGAGFSHIAVNRSQILVENPNDPLIGALTGIKRKYKPDLSAGLYLYSKNIFWHIRTAIDSWQIRYYRYKLSNKFGSTFIWYSRYQN